MLQVTGLQAGYSVCPVLWDVSLDVREGEFVALLGPNGAGKTTTLRTIAGLLRATGGDIRFLGQSITARPAHEITRLGLGYVTEDTNLFEKMTVRENLLLGAYTVRDKTLIRQRLDTVHELFPVLEQREGQLAGTLSGGERKMLALGRGLMSGPRLLLIDEPSLGLSPLMVTTVLKAMQALHRKGSTILLVEQNVRATLQITDRAYVLEQGHIVMQGPSNELVENAYLQDTYLGGADHGPAKPARAGQGVEHAHLS